MTVSVSVNDDATEVRVRNQQLLKSTLCCTQVIIPGLLALSALIS